MSLYLGQVIITAELLNRFAAPLLLRRYRLLKQLRFSISSNSITAQLSGNYSYFKFSGALSAELLLPGVGEREDCLDLNLHLNLRPRLLNPVAQRLIKKYTAHYPGISYSGERLCINPGAIAFFTEPRESLGGSSIFSFFRASPGENGGSGIPLNLYIRKERAALLESREGIE